MLFQELVEPQCTHEYVSNARHDRLMLPQFAVLEHTVATEDNVCSINTRRCLLRHRYSGTQGMDVCPHQFEVETDHACIKAFILSKARAEKRTCDG